MAEETEVTEPEVEEEEFDESDYYDDDGAEGDEAEGDEAESDESGDPKKPAGKEKPATKSELEDIARQYGWRPKDEYKGKQKWSDAAEYLRKQADNKANMLEQVKELRELKRGVSEVKKHIERSYKAENERLKAEISDLKAKRREAIEDGDVALVERIETDMDNLSKKVQEAETDTDNDAPATSNPDFEAWHQDNPWYGTDKEKTAYVDAQAGLPEFKGLPFNRAIDIIERRMKTVFGTAKSARRASPVEAPSNRQPKIFTERDLSRTERASMQRFIAQGILTKKDYLEIIARERGAK
jgi:hypothetical protein